MESAGAGGAVCLIDELMELTAQSLTELEINDRFDVIKEIGRGKYGHILLVTHRGKGTPMALKLLPRASTQRQVFLREYCTALSLSHPSIVALFGIAFVSEQHYVFAQELTGRDLLSSIQPKVGLPESMVKRCALQISSALGFMHGRGLVHRDVKPENVLLLDSGCSRVKLADFGLAQRRGALIRFIGGTLPYMSPELCLRVLRDGQVSVPPLAVEPSLDTWAFGVLLFCVLTGCFPWESCTPLDSFYREFSLWSMARGVQGAQGVQGARGAQRAQGERGTQGAQGEEGAQGVQEAQGTKGQQGVQAVAAVEWVEGAESQDVPSLWARFSPDALQMFQKLLALDPELRADVNEVQNFMLQDWLTQTEPSSIPASTQATPTHAYKLV